MSEPLILGIESSCDETGVALVRGCELLGESVASSVDQHVRFGGVVPEVASRAHLEAMTPTVRRALDSAGVRLSDVDRWPSESDLTRADRFSVSSTWARASSTSSGSG